MKHKICIEIKLTEIVSCVDVPYAASISECQGGLYVWPHEDVVDDVGVNTKR